MDLRERVLIWQVTRRCRRWVRYFERNGQPVLLSPRQLANVAPARAR